MHTLLPITQENESIPHIYKLIISVIMFSLLTLWIKKMVIAYFPLVRTFFLSSLALGNLDTMFVSASR